MSNMFLSFMSVMNIMFGNKKSLKQLNICQQLKEATDLLSEEPVCH
jgi:hypothetical protein